MTGDSNNDKGKWGGSTLRAYLIALFDLTSWKVALALALMILVSLTEGIGLLMLVPLLQLVGLDVEQGSIGKLAQFMSSIFMSAGIRPTLLMVLGIYVLITALLALLNRWQAVVNYELEQHFVLLLKQRLYQAITNSNWLFFSRSRASDFTHALTTEIDRVGMATWHLLFLITSIATASVYILLALRLSAAMTALVFFCGMALLFLFKGKMRAAYRSGEELSTETNNFYAASIEHLSGMKTTKSYGAEDRSIQIFSKLSERVVEVATGGVRNYYDMKFLLDVGSVVLLSLILYISFEVLSLPTTGALLLLFLFARIVPRLSSIQQSFQSFLNALPSFATVMGIEARCKEAAEPKATRAEKVRLQEALRLDHIFFTYEKPGSFIIRDLNLIIPAGQTTAIVGPSGAGKSSVADLAIGLITPDRGRVLIDENALTAERMQSWRDQIGYVAQDTFLFHDTVRANLLWAWPDATDEEMTEALRLAAAEEFVSALPNGMETILGDRGVRLSGGERQRLALARALLRKPALLILDEATSALDSENERRIQRAIEELHGQMTILVITHRLSTIRNADAIYVLEGGRLIEFGVWNSLVSNENGRFRAFCTAQNIDVSLSLEEMVNN